MYSGLSRTQKNTFEVGFLKERLSFLLFVKALVLIVAQVGHVLKTVKKNLETLIVNLTIFNLYKIFWPTQVIINFTPNITTFVQRLLLIMAMEVVQVQLLTLMMKEKKDLSCLKSFMIV